MRWVQLRRAAKTCAPHTCLLFFIPACLLIIVLLVRTHVQEAQALLTRVLETEELAELGLEAGWGSKALHTGNPWRGTRQGCGGRVRPSATAGRTLVVRYAVWGDDHQVVDSTRNRTSVAIVLGSGQAHALGGVRVLGGLCAGDVIEVALQRARRALVAVLRVDGDDAQAHEEAAVAARQDKLAEMTRAVGAPRRRTCDSVCRRHGLRCERGAFVVVNDCDRLRTAFHCEACEVAPAGAAGADMPCFVSPHAPSGFRRGLCLVAPHVDQSTCSAFHHETHRLCPCVAS